MTHNSLTTWAIPLVAAFFMALTGCAKKDQIAADLLSLNAAGKAATQSIDLQQAMGRVKLAKSNEEKAAILKESALGLNKIQSDLQRIEIRSPEVKNIQGRLAGAFGKVGNAADSAAKAFETNDAAALEKAGQAMQETQGDIMAVGKDAAALAQAHNVDLSK